jgi:hypothetical protein
VATVDAPLKGIEAKFKVKIRAIQDAMMMMGDPEPIFGPSKAVESLLELLAKANLPHNRAKSSASALRMVPLTTRHTGSSLTKRRASAVAGLTCGTRKRVKSF